MENWLRSCGQFWNSGGPETSQIITTPTTTLADGPPTKLPCMHIRISNKKSLYPTISALSVGRKDFGCWRRPPDLVMVSQTPVKASRCALKLEYRLTPLRITCGARTCVLYKVLPDEVQDTPHLPPVNQSRRFNHVPKSSSSHRKRRSQLRCIC